MEVFFFFQPRSFLFVAQFWRLNKTACENWILFPKRYCNRSFNNESFTVQRSQRTDLNPSPCPTLYTACIPLLCPVDPGSEEELLVICKPKSKSFSDITNKFRSTHLFVRDKHVHRTWIQTSEWKKKQNTNFIHYSRCSVVSVSKGEILITFISNWSMRQNRWQEWNEILQAALALLHGDCGKLERGRLSLSILARS